MIFVETLILSFDISQIYQIETHAKNHEIELGQASVRFPHPSQHLHDVIRVPHRTDGFVECVHHQHHVVLEDLVLEEVGRFLVVSKLEELPEIVILLEHSVETRYFYCCFIFNRI